LIFWDRKSRNRLFFNFFSTKVSDFISNLNDNCSQLSFEVYNVFVAQKLPISEFLIEFFSPGPWPLRRPPEAAISTSATSIGYQILVKYVSFHMRYCLLVWSENGEWLDYVSQNGWIPPPPRVFGRPKSPGLLGLSKQLFEVVFSTF
jgi:hypothetical protein